MNNSPTSMASEPSAPVYAITEENPPPESFHEKPFHRFWVFKPSVGWRHGDEAGNGINLVKTWLAFGYTHWCATKPRGNPSLPDHAPDCDTNDANLEGIKKPCNCGAQVQPWIVEAAIEASAVYRSATPISRYPDAIAAIIAKHCPAVPASEAGDVLREVLKDAAIEHYGRPMTDQNIEELVQRILSVLQPVMEAKEREINEVADWQRQKFAASQRINVKLTGELSALRGQLAEKEKERARWEKNYYDVADAICRESTGPEDLCRQACALRERLADAVEGKRVAEAKVAETEAYLASRKLVSIGSNGAFAAVDQIVKDELTTLRATNAKLAEGFRVVRSALLRTKGSLGLIIAGANAQAIGHKENNEVGKAAIEATYSLADELDAALADATNPAPAPAERDNSPSSNFPRE